MALIKCPECGNNVSDMAEMCPHCGHPIAAEKKAKKKKTNTNLLISIVSFMLIAVGPFLAYSKQKMSLLGNEEVNTFNMLKMLSLESGALKTGESASMFKIVPVVIILLGVLGIAITVLRNTNIMKIPFGISVLVPLLALVLLILFETIGLKSYYTNQKYMIDEAIKIGLAKDFYTVTKGAGFYVTLLGSIAGIVFSFLGYRKDTHKKQEVTQDE